MLDRGFFTRDAQGSTLRMMGMMQDVTRYNLLSAGEGTEAVALFAENRQKIALVLTDMIMPVMDGPSTIRALRKMDPKIRIIAVSGLMVPQKLDRIAQDEKIPVLAKPYSTPALLTTIHDLLQRQPAS